MLRLSVLTSLYPFGSVIVTSIVKNVAGSIETAASRHVPSQILILPTFKAVPVTVAVTATAASAVGTIQIDAPNKHKEIKAPYWDTGKIIDSVKNGYLGFIEPIEAEAKKIEKAEEIAAKAESERLNKERTEELLGLGMEAEEIPSTIGSFDDSMYSLIIDAAKAKAGYISMHQMILDEAKKTKGVDIISRYHEEINKVMLFIKQNQPKGENAKEVGRKIYKLLNQAAKCK